MDVRDYYKAVAEYEAVIEDPFVVIVSLKSPDGGRGGVMSEVKRATAARLVVEGRARFSTAEESTCYYAEQRERLEQAELAYLRNRVQVTVVSDKDMQALRGSLREV